MNFKKITAIATSTIMLGMTFGVAAAANYPAPFVSGSTADVAIVYGTGTGVSSLDLIQAGNIQTNLQSKVTTTGSTGGTGVSGESAQLWSGSDRVYFEDELADGGVTQLTKDDLPTILADGTFDNGADNDYSQRIELQSQDGYTEFTFDDSGSDLDDPALIIALGTSTTYPIYDLIVDFDSATNVTGSDSTGEKIELFGRTYTISSNTDADEIYLYESSETISLSIGGTDPTSQTVTVEGETYTIELTAASDDSATIKVTDSSGNSQAKEINEDSSKSVQGLEVAVDLADEDTATNRLLAQVVVGANEILLKHGDEVKVGSSRDGIDGTLVTLTPTGTNSALTQIKVSVTADDNDNDHLEVGDSFMDPVFGSMKLTFSGIANGPDLSSGEKDMNTDRTKIEVVRDTNTALDVKMTDKNGNTATVPFAYDSDSSANDNQVLSDEDGKQIFVLENQSLTTAEDEHYVILNSNGEYVAMGQIKTIDPTAATCDLTIEDVFTGDDIVDWDDQNVAATKTFTYKGKTFTVWSDGTNLKIEDATTTKTAVYPFIELFSGYNHRVAFTEDIDDVITTTGATAEGQSYILTLPTGDVTVSFANGTTECVATFTSGSTTAGTITTSTTDAVTDSLAIGTAYYNFTVTGGAGADNCTDAGITVDVGMDILQTGAGAEDTHAGLLIVEDEDATNSDAKEAIYIRTDDDGTTNYYLQTKTPIFTDTEVSGAYEADGLTGYLDRFGAYALADTDGDQDLIEVTLPKTQMYAEVYMAEEDSAITGGTGGSGALGEVLVKDTELSSVSSKNLIVVGGSCINSAAASLVGGSYCGSGWTEMTNVGSGQFLIESYGSSSITSKVALLVAGYDAQDTVNAAKYLTTQTVDTSAGKKYVGTSATSAELVVA